MISILFLLALKLNPPEVESLILSGLEYAYVEAFDQAEFLFDSLRNLHPDNPAGWFFKAALLQIYMMDACKTDREAEYYRLVDTTINKATRIINAQSDPWAYYYLGSVYTYRAIHEGSKKNYWGAFSLGLKGGKILKRLVETTPDFYDAYLGAGSFDYFWARASRYLPVLKLVGDFSKGVKELQLAMDKSIYSKTTARNALIWIYIQEGNYAEGLKMAENLVRDYPNGRTFLWSFGGILLSGKKYEQAMEIYERLYVIYNSLGRKNYANLAQSKLYVAKCLRELCRLEECRQACNIVIGFYRYRNEYPQIVNYVNEAKSIKKCL